MMGLDSIEGEMIHIRWLALAILITLPACSEQSSEPEPEQEEDGVKAVYASGDVVVDGRAEEAFWSTASWNGIDHVWLGTSPEADDFSGRFKTAWQADRLLLLAEITDDVLRDTHPDPLQSYWEDDCLEIFIDEDGSGGIHQYSYNAFAYHVALDGHAVDIGPDRQPALYDDHLQVGRRTGGTLSVWELAITVYSDIYPAEGAEVTLAAGKKMGLAVAYCDCDRGSTREHFIGSMEIPGQDKNRAWIDASLFLPLELLP